MTTNANHVPTMLTQGFADHFESNGFVFEQSGDVTTDNETLLFNISGGVQFEHVLTGEVEPAQARVASVQRSLRTDSLDRIGYSGRHHIAFDMMGHFAFFDAAEEPTKELAIRTAAEYMKGLGLTDELFATAHPDDQASLAILHSHLPSDRVIYDPTNTHVSNGRDRSGYRVELGRDLGDRHIELWNIVFTQFQGIGTDRKPLDTMAFDSGMSLDRLSAAVQGHESDYLAEEWQASLAGINDATEVHFRAADFARALLVLNTSGITPGPNKQQYIARKVSRELVRLEKHGIDVCAMIAAVNQAHLLDADEARTTSVYERERERYQKTISRGAGIVTRLVAKREQLTEADYDDLHQTHGLDRELVDSLLAERHTQ